MKIKTGSIIIRKERLDSSKTDSKTLPSFSTKLWSVIEANPTTINQSEAILLYNNKLYLPIDGKLLEDDIDNWYTLEEFFASQNLIQDYYEQSPYDEFEKITPFANYECEYDFIFSTGKNHSILRSVRIKAAYGTILVKIFNEYVIVDESYFHKLEKILNKAKVRYANFNTEAVKKFFGDLQLAPVISSGKKYYNTDLTEMIPYCLSMFSQKNLSELIKEHQAEAPIPILYKQSTHDGFTTFDTYEVTTHIGSPKSISAVISDHIKSRINEIEAYYHTSSSEKRANSMREEIEIISKLESMYFINNIFFYFIDTYTLPMVDGNDYLLFIDCIYNHDQSISLSNQDLYFPILLQKVAQYYNRTKKTAIYGIGVKGLKREPIILELPTSPLEDVIEEQDEKLTEIQNYNYDYCMELMKKLNSSEYEPEKYLLK